MKRIKIAFFGCSLLFFTAATAQTSENATQSVKQKSESVTYSKAGMMSAQAKNKPVDLYHAKDNQSNQGTQNFQLRTVSVDAHRLKKIEAIARIYRAEKK